MEIFETKFLMFISTDLQNTGWPREAFLLLFNICLHSMTISQSGRKAGCDFAPPDA